MRMFAALTSMLALAGAAPAAEASRLVFQSAASTDAARAGHSHLYSSTPRGTQRRAITRGSGLDSDPSVSPNGRQVAFIRRARVSSTRTELWVTGIGGSGARRLLRARFVGTPGWTPDGAWIAFSHPGGIDLVHPDGSERHALVKRDDAWEIYGLLDPTFSADGKLLAFSAEGGSQTSVYTMPADGTGTPTRVATGYFPAFAPSGDRIAYTGKGLCILSTGSGEKRCFGGKNTGGRGITPSWSPDGTQIAINRGYLPHPYQELAIVTVATGAEKRITRNFVDDIDPSWAR
jgi:Tol biopolymer transport system component